MPTWERVRGIASISKRYKSMYIPSDFCRWVEAREGHDL